MAGEEAEKSLPVPMWIGYCDSVSGQQRIRGPLWTMRRFRAAEEELRGAGATGIRSFRFRRNPRPRWRLDGSD